MNKMKISAVIISLITLCIGSLTYASAQNTVEVEGQVLEAGEAEAPLDYAVVSILPAELHTVTDSDGRFRFTGLRGGGTNPYSGTICRL